MGLIPGQEDPLEEGMATHSSIFAWGNPMVRAAGWGIVHDDRVGHDRACAHTLCGIINKENPILL